MQTALNEQDKAVHTVHKNKPPTQRNIKKNAGMHILQLPFAKGKNISCLSSYVWWCTESSSAATGSHWDGYLD